MKFDHFEFHTRRGLLLIGAATDGDIAHWQKALGQKRMREDAVAALRELHGDQASGLRQLATKLDLLPRPSPMDDRQIRDVVLRAINGRRVAAVFLPIQHASVQINLPTGRGSRSGSAVSRLAARSVASMSPAQRIETMLGRVPDHLNTVQRLKAAFLALVSPESLAMLALSLAALAAAQAAGVGEIVDAAFAGVAYYEAGVAGLWALLDMIKAVTNAATATTDPEIDRAADLFATAFIVIGTTILWVFLQKAQSRGGSGDVEELSNGGRNRTATRQRVKLEKIETGPLSNKPRTFENLFPEDNLVQQTLSQIIG